MRNSTRAALAIGLGLVGVAGIVVPSRGQAPDAAVRPANGAAPARAEAPKAAPAVIGTIDLELVLKNYDGFRAAMEGIEADAMARSNDLMKIQSEASGEMEKLKSLAPGGLDQKRIEARLSELKIRLQSGKEQAQMELSRKEAEIIAKAYNEIQQMSQSIAKMRGMTMVVKTSAAPPSASDPKSIEAALFRSVIYSDPKLDLTSDVTKWLNHWYKQRGGQPPKGRTEAAAPAPATAAGPAAAPR